MTSADPDPVGKVIADVIAEQAQRVEALEAERDDLKAKLVEAERERDVAWRDNAHRKWMQAKANERAETAEADRDALSAKLDEACGLLDTVPVLVVDRKAAQSRGELEALAYASAIALWVERARAFLAPKTGEEA